MYYSPHYPPTIRRPIEHAQLDVRVYNRTGTNKEKRAARVPLRRARQPLARAEAHIARHQRRQHALQPPPT